jgi:hypothetical protein
MPIITDPSLAKPFVFEPEVTPHLQWIHEQCLELFSHLPNIFTQKPETKFFTNSIKEHYRLFDPDKPMMQVVYLSDIPEFKELSEALGDAGFTRAVKFFQSDPTDPRFKSIEHLFFCHRHHYTSSVASLVFPIAGCDENTITSWAAYEDVDGYIPDDPSIGVYWSEYYWKTYKKNSDRFLLSDDEAACRYALTDRPVLWNVKQWHEAINTGEQHRVIANINFKSATQTWEESINIVKGLI